MNTRFRSRLDKLETLVKKTTRPELRIGPILEAFEKINGPSHIAVITTEPVVCGMQWCTFQLRPGWGPPDDGVPRHYLSPADMNL